MKATGGAGSGEDVRIRPATPADVQEIVGFGAEVIPAHYSPLIGADAAQSQVEQWWDAESIAEAVAAALVVVADVDGRIVGIGQRGSMDGEHVVWKLYVHPCQRGRGLGPRLLDALAGQLLKDAQRLWIEHFASNERAGAFYEREGFTVDRVVSSPTGAAGMAQVWRVRRLLAPEDHG